MNAIELKDASGTRSVWACGICNHTVYGGEANANRCCKCDKTDCDRPAVKHSIYCEEHRLANHAEMDAASDKREAARFEKAVKVSWRDYDGPVYHSDARGTCGDGYFRDVGELVEEFLDNEKPVPKYCYATYKLGLALDARRWIEDELADEHHEDAIDELDIDALQKLVDEWLKTNQTSSFMQNDAKVVLLDGIEEPAP